MAAKKNKKSKQPEPITKNRLNTSVEIYNRLFWDDSLGLDKTKIIIVHHVCNINNKF